MTTPANPAVTQGPQPSVIQTHPRDVHITAREVQPNIRLYLQDEDQLQLVALANFNNVQIKFTARYLMPDGQIIPSVWFVTAPTAGTYNQLVVPVAEGYLLTISMGVVGILNPGQWAWGNVTLFRGILGNYLGFDEILSGYVTANYAPSWPEWPPQRPLDGPGCLRSITGSVPAAGADISETVPANRRWLLLSFRAGLTTSATVANRQVAFAMKDNGVNINFISQSSVVQAASLSWNYTLGPWGTASVQNLLEVSVPSFQNQILGAGYKINTNTTSLAGTDQWTAPQYLVLEWADLE